MTSRDASGPAALSPEEVAAGERAGRKRLGEDGRPENRRSLEAPRVDGASEGTVPENEEPGVIDSIRGMADAISRGMPDRRRRRPRQAPA